MASDPNFSAWYFAYCQEHNRTPSQEDVWKAGREFGRGDTVTAHASPAEQAATQAEAPKGWKLVPIEPTDEMLSKAVYAIAVGTARQVALTHYKAMLDAAPTAPTGAQPVGADTLTDAHFLVTFKGHGKVTCEMVKEAIEGACIGRVEVRRQPGAVRG